MTVRDSKQSGWNDVLCEAVGVSRKLLPEVFAADHVSGGVTKRRGEAWMTSGTPVLAA